MIKMIGSMAILLLGGGLLLFFALRTPPPAAGQPAISSLFTSAPPTIDGVLSAGEWSNKRTIAMNGFNDPNRTMTADLYVMNDAVNVYVAVVFSSPPETKTRTLYIDLDTNHDHVAADGAEDAMSVQEPFGIYYDLFWSASFGWWKQDTGAQQGSGMASLQGGIYTFEFSKPLNSGDAQDMSVALGGQLGFRLELWDGAAPDEWFRYPTNTVDSDTMRWGEWADLTLATASTATPTATPTLTPTPTPGASLTPTPTPTPRPTPASIVHLPVAAKALAGGW